MEELLGEHHSETSFDVGSLKATRSYRCSKFPFEVPHSLPRRSKGRNPITKRTSSFFLAGNSLTFHEAQKGDLFLSAFFKKKKKERFVGKRPRYEHLVR